MGSQRVEHDNIEAHISAKENLCRKILKFSELSDASVISGFKK